MHARIADSLLPSRLYLDRYIFDECLILAVVSNFDGPTKIGCVQVSSANTWNCLNSKQSSKILRSE